MHGHVNSLFLTFPTKVQFQCGNERFREIDTRLKITPRLKSDILEKQVEEIFQYKEYSRDYQIYEVAWALSKKSPV